MTRAKEAPSSKQNKTSQRSADRVSRKSLPKPFLKWVGGKGQLVPQLLGHLPADFNSYHEPFLGGGAMFFALHRAGLLEGKKVTLSDINQELIDTYVAIRDQLNKVIHHLLRHRYEKDYFYLIRELDPSKLSIAEKAARTIFLNRTAFNGLYRVNSKGKYNVPFGRYEKPKICDLDLLQAAAKALQNVEIRCLHFKSIVNRAHKGDFVYFDPPYVPISVTAKFVSYSRDGFSLLDQKHLSEIFARLATKGVCAMLSNSDTSWIQTHYEGFQQIQVMVRRSVNARADKRGPVRELIILNY